MSQLKNIETLEDIELLVNNFYNKVQNDELLKDIFNNVIGDKWPQHLKKMYRFWQTVLLEEHTYHGSPFLPHAELPIDEVHFNRWIELFIETLNQNFAGRKAEQAKSQAERMAEMFLYKIRYYRNNSAIPIL